jgi:general secretion pathway protein K
MFQDPDRDDPQSSLVQGRPPCKPFSQSGRDRGFALLIVLWTLVLIAFVIAHVTATGRSELRIAGNLKSNAVAQAAADGAIYETIFNLADPRQDQRWLADGSSHILQIGASRILVRVEDEDGFINPNLASAALLEGLLRVVGAEPARAVDLARAITEWVGSAKARRSPEELLAEYRAAGLDYGPPRAPPRSPDAPGATAPLESIDELGRVRGMDPRLLAALRPHLTLFGSGVPNVDTADPIVTAALDFARANGAPEASASPSTNANSQFVTARIHATAQGPGSAEVTRTAVVLIGAADRGYSLLTWGSGAE